MKTTNHEACLQFLEALNLSAVDAVVNVWTLQGQKSHFFPTSDLNAIAGAAVRLGADCDAYMAVSVYPEKPEKRGAADEASHVIGLFADIDIKTEDKHKNCPPDKETALSILESFPLKPGIIVDSGRGIHAHWPFESPVPINSVRRFEQIRQYYERFQLWVLAHFKEAGYALDGVGDMARLFRIPGTFNHKQNPPLPVLALQYNPDAKLTLERLMVTLDRHAPHLSEMKPASTADNKTFPPADAEKIADECAWFKHCIDDAAALSEQEWYAFVGIVGHCKNGQDLAHEYSKPYPKYSESETQGKIHHALKDAGPRTCTYIHHDLGCEEYCSQCPHWGQVKSPISLGYKKNESLKNLALVVCQDAELWHTPDKIAYATVAINGIKHHFPIEGGEFSDWLSGEVFSNFGKAVNDRALKDAISILKAKARYQSSEHKIFLRVAGHDA